MCDDTFAFTFTAAEGVYCQKLYKYIHSQSFTKVTIKEKENVLSKMKNNKQEYVGKLGKSYGFPDTVENVTTFAS